MFRSTASAAFLLVIGAMISGCASDPQPAGASTATAPQSAGAAVHSPQTMAMLEAQSADETLSRTERLEMQILLGHLGYAVGAPDGVVGDRTRSAIRGYQASAGLPATGYYSRHLLVSLRAAVNSMDAARTATPSAPPAEQQAASQPAVEEPETAPETAPDTTNVTGGSGGSTNLILRRESERGGGGGGGGGGGW